VWPALSSGLPRTQQYNSAPSQWEGPFHPLFAPTIFGRLAPSPPLPIAMNALKSRYPLLVLALGGLLSAGCGDTTNPEHGGTYVATVTAPAGHVDGAAVVELAGRGVESVTPVDGRLFVERLPGDYTRVVIVGADAGPLRFQLELARGNDMPRVTLIEVADTADALRPSLNGYRVSFER
jgi:hypothetical protein